MVGVLERGVEEALVTDYRVCSPDQFLSKPGRDSFQKSVGVAAIPYPVWKLQRRKYNHFWCIPDLDLQLPLVTGTRFQSLDPAYLHMTIPGPMNSSISDEPSGPKVFPACLKVCFRAGIA